jgi:hypothetical protein
MSETSKALRPGGLCKYNCKAWTRAKNANQVLEAAEACASDPQKEGAKKLCAALQAQLYTMSPGIEKILAQIDFTNTLFSPGTGELLNGLAADGNGEYNTVKMKCLYFDISATHDGFGTSRTGTAVSKMCAILADKANTKTVCFDVSMPMPCINIGWGCVTLPERVLQPLHMVFRAVCRAKGIKIASVFSICRGAGDIMNEVYTNPQNPNLYRAVPFRSLTTTHICFLFHDARSLGQLTSCKMKHVVKTYIEEQDKVIRTDAMRAVRAAVLTDTVHLESPAWRTRLCARKQGITVMC